MSTPTIKSLKREIEDLKARADEWDEEIGMVDGEPESESYGGPRTEADLEWLGNFLSECNVTVTITDAAGGGKTLLDTDECGDIEMTLETDPVAPSSERRLLLHVDTPYPEPEEDEDGDGPQTEEDIRRELYPHLPTDASIAAVRKTESGEWVAEIRSDGLRAPIYYSNLFELGWHPRTEWHPFSDGYRIQIEKEAER